MILISPDRRAVLVRLLRGRPSLSRLCLRHHLNILDAFPRSTVYSYRVQHRGFFLLCSKTPAPNSDYYCLPAEVCITEPLLADALKS